MNIQRMLFVAILAASACFATADLAFSNLTTTQGPLTFGFAGSEAGPNLPAEHGERFSSLSTGEITEVSVLMGFSPDITGGDLAVSLYADDGGAIGSLVGTFVLEDVTGELGVHVKTFGAIDSGVMLNAGQNYWFVLGAGAPSAIHNWVSQSLGQIGRAHV